MSCARIVEVSAGTAGRAATETHQCRTWRRPACRRCVGVTALTEAYCEIQPTPVFTPLSM